MGNHHQQVGLVGKLHNLMGYSEYEDSRRAIGRAFHVIRGMLSKDEALALTHILPSDLMVIYLSSWKLDAPSLSIKHLDEFIISVKQLDEGRRRSVFHSEIEALKCSLLVLELLDKELNILKLLPDTLYQEVKQALIHPAA
ncbi:DUF2267 domain-containing protein [Fulvivirga sp.]|uniref:DUF2267 domain-containing protein n=1 Tax=Fulvivirga sp. TaxID=1931237 RepID=UPI0032EE965C